MSNLLSSIILGQHFDTRNPKDYFGLIPDWLLKNLNDFLPENEKLIIPFQESIVREVDGKKIISYGCGSHGYDIRVADEFKIFSNSNGSIMDPKQVDDNCWINKKADPETGKMIIPSNGYALCRSSECFNLPRDITAIAIGKSTYARCGIIVNITPLEAGWTGYLTIEISNSSPVPAIVYANEGIAQLLFFKNLNCNISYMDRGGKYQNQAAEVVTAKL